MKLSELLQQIQDITKEAAQRTALRLAEERAAAEAAEAARQATILAFLDQVKDLENEIQEAEKAIEAVLENQDLTKEEKTAIVAAAKRAIAPHKARLTKMFRDPRYAQAKEILAARKTAERRQIQKWNSEIVEQYISRITSEVLGLRPEVLDLGPDDYRLKIIRSAWSATSKIKAAGKSSADLKKRNEEIEAGLKSWLSKTYGLKTDAVERIFKMVGTKLTNCVIAYRRMLWWQTSGKKAGLPKPIFDGNFVQKRETVATLPDGEYEVEIRKAKSGKPARKSESKSISVEEMEEINRGIEGHFLQAECSEK